MPSSESSIFDDGLESLDRQDAEQDILEKQAETFSSESENILDADYIDASVEGHSKAAPVKGSKKAAKKKLTYILGALVGFGVFVAVVIAYAPDKSTGIVQSNLSTVESNATPYAPKEPQQKTVSSFSTPVEAVAPNVEKNKVLAPKQSLETPDTPPHKEDVKTPQQTEPKKQTVEVEKVEDRQLLETLAIIQNEMKELKAVMAKQDEVKTTKKVIKKVNKSNQKKAVYLGYAFGVVQILEDAVVYQDASGDFHVIKIGEKYKKYGALKSVNPAKKTYITTRGLWRVK